MSHTLQFLILGMAGWVNRQQQEVIEYLRTENQVRKEAHGKRRIRLNDNQRRRLAVKGKVLDLQLQFSHPVEFPIPEDITITCPDNTHITIAGIDKQRVGQIAAEIRAYRKPEPYKGKGIRYVGEYVVRKAGKAAGK